MASFHLIFMAAANNASSLALLTASQKDDVLWIWRRQRKMMLCSLDTQEHEQPLSEPVVSSLEGTHNLE